MNSTMLAPVLVTPPAEYPVSIEQAKAQLRITDSADDVLLDGMIAAATEHLDGWRGSLGGVCLVRQTWRSSFNCFPCGASYGCGSAMQNVLRLPFMPVISIASVKYYDSAGVQQTVSGSAYRLLTDALGGFVASVPDAASPWPSAALQSRADAVAVEAVYGFGDAPDVPAPIVSAITLRVGRLHALAKRDATLRSQVVDGVGSRTWGGLEALAPSSAAEEALVANYRRIFL